MGVKPVLTLKAENGLKVLIKVLKETGYFDFRDMSKKRLEKIK
jgi:hypothetical protein